MKRLLPLALLMLGAAPVDHPRTFLFSIGRIPLRDPESIEAFSIRTWGVRYKSVCRLPVGWRIKVGSGATPDGTIEGEGSQGITWFHDGSPRALHAFILVTLYAPVQRADIGPPGNGIPATFDGTATIMTDDGDIHRPLSWRNVTLTPARRCPTS